MSERPFVSGRATPRWRRVAISVVVAACIPVAAFAGPRVVLVEDWTNMG